MEPGACNFRGRRSRVLSYKLFLLFYLWLVASLFADSERALLLASYETPWVIFEFSDLPFSG
jgi:hypothetical protein